MSGSSTGSGGGAAAAALRAAASSGDLATCSRLLNSARCVRFSRDELGRSALHLAASNGHCSIVRLLLNVAAPKEVDSPDGNGCTALQRAAADGHEEVLRLLLARGADVDKQDSVHGNTALHESSWKGYSKSVRLLSAAGANLSKLNSGGFTSLHLCCQNGHNQSCRELLLAGCNPNIQNNYGDTSLHTAARYGHAGVTRILISAQCHVNEQNKNGDTALHIASAMGRRKLTRILLEAGCDKNIRNKQNETAKDIALRKDLNEILTILEDSGPKREKNKSKSGRKRSKSKVRFEAKHNNNPTTVTTPNKDVVDGGAIPKPKHWSPYGCHYYPDPEAFPSPRLDSLPQEPLKRGEQYYLDLAGNICKGPVGVGYTCYCAPLFRHLEARLERDKRELYKAQIRLGQRVAGLEQKLNRNGHGRRSERIIATNREGDNDHNEVLQRSRSLEMLDKIDNRNHLQTTRSMDELDPVECADNNTDQQSQRPSVKELIARIQQHQPASLTNPAGPNGDNNNNSESSDDEDGPALRMNQRRGPMGDSNLVTVTIPMPNYENLPSDSQPRSRSGMYSPTAMMAMPNLIDSNNKRCYIEPIVKIQESVAASKSVYNGPSTSSHDLSRYYSTNNNQNYHNPHHITAGYVDNMKYVDLNSRFAKLRMLAADNNNGSGNVGADNNKSMTTSSSSSHHHRMLDSNKMFESTTRMLDNPQDTIDRDTNNDSGYSTKVYGSSKGNSPSLSGGQIDECLGASSLV